MSTDAELLLIDDVDGVITLTLNRPDQFNALSQELLGALQRALADIAGNEQARCVVLAANGRAFCAGHDLKQMGAQDRKSTRLNSSHYCASRRPSSAGKKN